MRTLLIAVSLLVLCGAAMAGNGPTDNYATPTGSLSAWGVWEYSNANNDGTGWAWFGANGLQHNNLAVSANVEYWEQDNFDASSIVFHFGRTDGAASVSQIVNGEIWANSTNTIDIWGTGACNDITKLTGPGDPIAVTWEYGQGGSFSPCVCAGDKAQAFPSGLPVGDQKFQIRVTATPGTYQAPGAYVLDPVIAAVPVL